MRTHQLLHKCSYIEIDGTIINFFDKELECRIPKVGEYAMSYHEDYPSYISNEKDIPANPKFILNRVL